MSEQTLSKPTDGFDGALEIWNLVLGSITHGSDEALVFISIRGICRKGFKCGLDTLCGWYRTESWIGPRSVDPEHSFQQIWKVWMFRNMGFKCRQIVQMPNQCGVGFCAVSAPVNDAPGESAKFVGSGFRRRNTSDSRDFGIFHSRFRHKGLQRAFLGCKCRGRKRHLKSDVGAQNGCSQKIRGVTDQAPKKAPLVADEDILVLDRPATIGTDCRDNRGAIAPSLCVSDVRSGNMELEIEVLGETLDDAICLG